MDEEQERLNILLSSIEEEIQHRERDVAALIADYPEGGGTIADHERTRSGEGCGARGNCGIIYNTVAGLLRRRRRR